MRGSDGIYFDNAATSWPKPPAVLQAMGSYLDEVGASPGRSAHHLSVAAARLVYDAREAIAQLFHVADPLRVVFTKNVTEALNLALLGLLRPGDHVVTDGMQHNAIMRPLRGLEHEGVEVTVAPSSPEGELDVADIERSLRRNTRLIVLNHASNVVGTLAPVRAVGEVARRHGVLLLVDAAQTAGCYRIEMDADGIDLLGFTGHKSLLGPQGTGGLVIGDRVPLEDLRPLMRGGTGSRSEEEEQPAFLPDRYESGTPNAVGLAGLGAAVRYVLDIGVEAIRGHEVALTRRLLEGLCAIDGVRVYGTGRAERQTATVSFNVEGVFPSDVGLELDEEYGIMCRVGLHCAPSAHRTMGTFPGGTVRFGLGYFNTSEEVDAALRAVVRISELGCVGETG